MDQPHRTATIVDSTRIDHYRGRAMVYMVISSVVISFGGLLMRIMEAATPWQINFYRATSLLGVVMTIIVIRYGRQALHAIAAVGKLGMVGGVLLGIAGIAFLQSLVYTTVANTLFILGSIPFFTALFARILLKEKLKKATLITMTFAAIGLSAMVIEGISIGSGFGNAMALLTAVGFALYAVIVRGRRKVDMYPVLIYSSLLIILVSLFKIESVLTISIHDFILCFIWGGLLSGVANWLFIYASRHLAAAEVTLIMLLEFALGPIWVWWFVNETPSRWTLIGGALIIFAVAARATIELLANNRVAPESKTHQK